MSEIIDNTRVSYYFGLPIVFRSQMSKRKTMIKLYLLVHIWWDTLVERTKLFKRKQDSQ